MDATAIAREYELGLGLEHRRTTGTIYTPAPIVDLVLDQAGYSPDEEIETRTLLDPSCGCGVFLTHAIRRLALRMTMLGENLSHEQGRSKLLRVVERALWGVDKDPAACALARQLVRGELRQHLGHRNVPEAFFEDNVIAADFLDQPRLAGLDAAGQSRPKRFDFVVGNPPYVSTARLPSAEKERLRHRYITARGRIDLYAVFIERALEELAIRGVLAFITPDKYLTSESSRPLRDLVTRSAAVQRMVRFRSHRIFGDAAIVPCITVVQRDVPAQRELLYSEFQGDSAAELEHARIQFRTAPAPPSGGAPWYFLEQEMSRLVMMLSRSGRPLERVASRISAGIATGRDSIFVVSKEEAQNLEDNLLHPVVRGKDIGPLQVSEAKEWLIVPYQGHDSGVPRLIDIQRFPRLKRYLTPHKEELLKRHCVRAWGKQWFDLHDTWTFPLSSTPKILFPDVANSNRFVFDPGLRCPLHSTYYIIPAGIDGELLTAILNSEVVELLVRSHAPVVKDGFSRYRRQFLLQVPIPDVSTREQTAILKASRALDFDGLNRHVGRIYGLTQRDQDRVSTLVASMRGDARQGSALEVDDAQEP